jgi:hypothetical protein
VTVLRFSLAFATIWATATAALADPLAVLNSNNGTVAPPYRIDVTVIVEADLRVTVTACKGYDEANCEVSTGLTTGAAIAAIEAAARAAGCPGNPLAEQENPPVGGGFSSGAVRVGGVSCTLPAFAIPADEGRKQSIIAAINAAVPPQLSRSAE